MPLSKTPFLTALAGRSLQAGKDGISSLGSLARTAEECSVAGGKCIPVVCDHASDASTQALFEQVESTCGRLDLLVNNAYGHPGSLHASFWKAYACANPVAQHVHMVSLKSVCKGVRSLAQASSSVHLFSNKICVCAKALLLRIAANGIL